MYALGCTFFHLLTGEPPYDGPTAFVIASHHMTSPVPHVRDFAPRTPPALAAIVERCMQKEASARYADYDALLAALDDAAPERTRYAGFAVRSAANSLDFLVAGGLIALVGWRGLFVHLVYVTIAHAFFGQTLAKLAFAIRVQRPDGHAIGLFRALVRTVVSLWLPFVVGVTTLFTRGATHVRTLIEHMTPRESAELQSIVMAIAISHGVLTLLYLGGLAFAAFDRRHRAFHDLLVDSEVVYRIREETVIGQVKSATKKIGARVRTPRP
jgi:uncharacterized RDD family membrane protein YckC